MRPLLFLSAMIAILAGCPAPAPTCADLTTDANCPAHSHAECTFPTSTETPDCVCDGDANDFDNGAGCVLNERHDEHDACCNCLNERADQAGGHRCLVGATPDECIAALDADESVNIFDVDRCLSQGVCGPDCPSEVPQ